MLQEKETNSRKGIARRSTSLRQTRSPQISLELQVPMLHSAFTPLSTQPTTTTPKKSNWEVIEHFNNAEKSRGSVSSSLIAVSNHHFRNFVKKKNRTESSTIHYRWAWHVSIWMELDRISLCQHQIVLW